MSLELTKADLMKCHTDALTAVYSRPENLAAMGEAAAESMKAWFEGLDAETMAALLRWKRATLMRRYKRLGLKMSVAFGRSCPIFFLSNFLEVAAAKCIEGRKPEGTNGTNGKVARVREVLARRAG